MTIKPVLSQKPGKHEKKELQDDRNSCLTKSPSPQRELQKASASNVVRRRRSPHKRIKRGELLVRDRVEATCKSPSSYQVDCATLATCSSPHSNAGKSPKTTHGVGTSTTNNNSNNNGNSNSANVLEDSFSGYNSGDEHIGQKDAKLSPEEWELRDNNFVKAMTERGFIVNEIAEDGACLFRSISLQIYGDQDMHEVIRQQTMDYIYKNREYFAQFVTEDITSYISRKRNNHVHGNHIEIQAISEIYNRPVELYSYAAEPINIFNSDQIKQGYEPFRLSYQRGSHYNAILNPYKASVGVGLGLAGYRPDEPDLKQMRDAVRLSEDLEIEQTMFEDKLKTTDWEATNEAIEEQIARESYLQWRRENMQKQPQKSNNTSSSTVTSSDISENPNNNSPSFSGGESSFDSEDFTPYQSDEDRCTAAASENGASSSGMSNVKTDAIFYLQQQRQRRNKKRRRGGCGSPSVAGSSSSSAGPSNSTGDNTVQDDTDYNKHSTPKSIKLSPERDNVSTNKSDEIPGTSKQSPPNEKSESTTFYHALLQSSYSDDFSDLDQLSEEKMVQKALQMSRMDFMQQLHKTDSDPPSP